MRARAGPGTTAGGVSALWVGGRPQPRFAGRRVDAHRHDEIRRGERADAVALDVRVEALGRPRHLTQQIVVSRPSHALPLALLRRDDGRLLRPRVEARLRPEPKV